jgi:Uma2 family endonuclease
MVVPSLSVMPPSQFCLWHNTFNVSLIGDSAMSLQPQSYLSPADYLVIERNAEFKSEYFDGEIFAMSGASEAHNIIDGYLALAEVYDKVEFQRNA